MALETLYLLRHAHAEDSKVVASEYADDRPLSEEGRSKMRAASPNMGRVIERLDLILTSPLSRTKETAEILRDSLDVPVKLQCVEELQPGATTEAYRRVLVENATNMRSVMLVGHEPDLGAFLASVLRGMPSAFAFKRGMLARVDMNDYSASLRFFIPNFVFRID